MRNPAVPFGLLVVVAALTFGLAQWTPFAPTTTSTPVTTGSAARGEGIFAATCAGCHGADASGGVGPALADSGLGAEEVVGIVAAGRGTMPGGLVEGQEAADVAAYVGSLSQ